MEKRSDAYPRCGVSDCHLYQKDTSCTTTLSSRMLPYNRASLYLEANTKSDPLGWLETICFKCTRESLATQTIEFTV